MFTFCHCHVIPSEDTDSESEKETANASNLCNGVDTDIEDETRKNLVIELIRTEKSYVASLEVVVLKYLQPLESPDNTGMVIEIFRMVPTILNEHKQFLDELERRLDSWDPLQIVGDAFIETFSKSTLLDAYSTFVYNWNLAKDAIRSTSSTFTTFPKYEPILSDLVEQTKTNHPDHKLLQEAIQLARSISLHLKSKERQAAEFIQRRKHLQDLAVQTLCLLRNFDKNVVDVLMNVNERQFLSFDLVTIVSEPAGWKKRGIILFSDLLVITTKSNSCHPSTFPCTMDTIKFTFLTKIRIDDLNVLTTVNDEDVGKGIENPSTEFKTYGQMMGIATSLRSTNRRRFGDIVNHIRSDIQRQLAEKQMKYTQRNILELAVRKKNTIQRMSIIFSRPEKCTQWENMLKEIKRKKHGEK